MVIRTASAMLFISLALGACSGAVGTAPVPEIPEASVPNANRDSAKPTSEPSRTLAQDVVESSDEARRFLCVADPSVLPRLVGEASDAYATSALQSLLSEILNVVMNVDGIYSKKTRSSVRLFQAGKGLDPDGVVGPKTWSALSEISCGPSESQVPFARELPESGGATRLTGPRSTTARDRAWRSLSSLVAFIGWTGDQSDGGCSDSVNPFIVAKGLLTPRMSMLVESLGMSNIEALGALAEGYSLGCTQAPDEATVRAGAAAHLRLALQGDDGVLLLSMCTKYTQDPDSVGQVVLDALENPVLRDAILAGVDEFFMETCR